MSTSTGPREPRRVVAAIAIGVAVAIVYTLSPLTVVFLLLAPLVLWAATRGLPPGERRLVVTIVLAALGLRIAVVAALFLAGDYDNQAATILVPDEAYTLARTLRIRNVLLGIPALKYDYGIAFEDYGRTSYLWVVTAAQLVFGPSPYGMRLVSMLFFLTGALLLFRLVRRAFGPLPSIFGLLLLVFFPTWLLWSVSLLKEPLYFLLAALALTAAVACCRGDSWRQRVLAAVTLIAAIYALRDLRSGAVVLIGSGLALGVVLYLLTASTRRVVAGTTLAILAGAALLAVPAVQSRVVNGLQSAARVHIGHVFTVGHPYKLLDEGFYVKLDLEPALTPAEAARFAVRAAVSLFVVPLPHQIVTRSELLQLPEHLIWYLLVLCAIPGIAEGLRRDRLVTCLLAGYALPTAAVVALTNGNVGTLLRFRGLITPYLVWLGCLGFCVIMQRLLSSSRAAGVTPIGVTAIREPS